MVIGEASLQDIAPSVVRYGNGLDTSGKMRLDDGALEDGDVTWRVTLPEDKIANLYVFDAGSGVIGINLLNLKFGNNVLKSFSHIILAK